MRDACFTFAVTCVSPKNAKTFFLGFKPLATKVIVCSLTTGTILILTTLFPIVFIIFSGTLPDFKPLKVFC